MTHIVFFGHNAADSAVRRRVKAFQDDGLTVTGFMMSRNENVAPEWQNISLGYTRDGAFFDRVGRIFSGARIAAAHKAELQKADLIYARNLDMLACAFLAKRHLKLDTPVIYESLDVHRLLTRPDSIGKLLRYVEGRLLERSAGLVVSSPGFLKHHFDKHYKGKFTPYLIENRLTSGADYGARPAKTVRSVQKLCLGWVGILRCQRSFDLLCSLADRFPDTLEIRLHGLPARTEVPVFEPEIDRRQNMHYFGKYRSPEDLSDIYKGLDVVWAGDFMEAGYNSVWLLPNRIYEGGYYGVPSIAPKGTQTAAWIEERDCGFTIDEPLSETLGDLVSELIDNPELLKPAVTTLLDLPEEQFIQPAGLVGSVIRDVLESRCN